MSRGARALLLALAIIGAGCRAPEPPLRIVHRLLDELPAPPRDSGISIRRYVGLHDERRPAAAAARGIRLRALCPPPAGRRAASVPCRLRLPARAPKAPAWIVETAPIGSLRVQAKRAAGRKPRRPAHLGRRLRFVLAGDPKRAALELPAWLTPFAYAWPAPSVPARDLLAKPYRVPAGAILAFAIGTEEPAWDVEAPAVEFAVEASSPQGTRRLFRRILDPSRRPADRGWQPVRIPLGSFAGQTVRLRFTVRPARPGPLAPQLPLWGDPVVLAPARPGDAARPSVVLVSLDTLRAKSVSAYGYPVPTTPFLERFSGSALRFANAFTTYSNTFGAHESMLTGAYPSTHARGGSTHRLSDDVPALAERLRAAGYTTAAFTEDALLDATAGFERGFTRYWENKTVDTGAGDAPGTFGRALAWLEANRDRAVFLFVHTYAVHAPYAPREPYASMFLDRGIERPAQLAYEQEVRQLDDDVRRLIAGIDRLLDPSRTLLIITADHGEEFGEHTAFSHVQLYDEVLHVPLWIRWAGRIPASRRLDQIVSLVDLPATVVDLLDLPRARGDGQSLVPLWRGGGRPPRPVVFAESPPSPWSQRQWSHVARSAAAKCFAFEDPALDRCYDLTRDPGERTPASGTPDLDRLALAARVFANLAIKARGDRPPGPRATAGDDAPDPARTEKLRALGYVE